jgi:hypothetical protein
VVSVCESESSSISWIVHMNKINTASMFHILCIYGTTYSRSTFIQTRTLNKPTKTTIRTCRWMDNNNNNNNNNNNELLQPYVEREMTFIEENDLYAFSLASLEARFIRVSVHLHIIGCQASTGPAGHWEILKKWRYSQFCFLKWIK